MLEDSISSLISTTSLWYPRSECIPALLPKELSFHVLNTPNSIPDFRELPQYLHCQSYTCGGVQNTVSHMKHCRSLGPVLPATPVALMYLIRLESLSFNYLGAIRYVIVGRFELKTFQQWLFSCIRGFIFLMVYVRLS